MKLRMQFEKEIANLSDVETRSSRRIDNDHFIGECIKTVNVNRELNKIEEVRCFSDGTL